ncbi:hypothetical protein DMUE_4574 [Dictyocoela muelleri]|nr:hypothetical protein DMUE_4574 [Dictyocoela muelleri]
MSKEKSELKTLINKTHDLVKALGMNINFDKSATNFEIEINDRELLKDKYKYLGIVENFGCQISDINLKLIEEKLLSRINTLVDINMSAKNKSIAINEYAIGVINYFI